VARLVGAMEDVPPTEGKGTMFECAYVTLENGSKSLPVLE